MLWTQVESRKANTRYKAVLPEPVTLVVSDQFTDTAVAAIRRFDPGTRCWVTYLVDEGDYQVGNADYTHGHVNRRKADAIVWNLINSQSRVFPKAMTSNG